MIYEEQVENFFENYILDFGQVKFHDVAKKLLTSNSVKRFLAITSTSQYAPNHNDIVGTVMNIPYFGFGKKTTIALGGVMLMHTWNEEINKQRELLNPMELCLLMEQIIKKCMGLL